MCCKYAGIMLKKKKREVLVCAGCAEQYKGEVGLHERGDIEERTIYTTFTVHIFRVRQCHQAVLLNLPLPEKEIRVNYSKRTNQCSYQAFPHPLVIPYRNKNSGFWHFRTGEKQHFKKYIYKATSPLFSCCFEQNYTETS